MPYKGSDQILVGNGQGLQISSSGSTFFHSPINSSVKLVFSNLLHVPKITKNLVSVSKFAKDNHVFFEFHSDKCLVKSQVTNEVLLRGEVGADGLYQFTNLHLLPKHTLLSSQSVPSPDVSSCNVSFIPSVNIAHVSLNT